MLLVLSITFLSIFLLISSLTENDVDDDDDHQGGMMVPASAPIS